MSGDYPNLPPPTTKATVQVAGPPGPGPSRTGLWIGLAMTAGIVAVFGAPFWYIRHRGVVADEEREANAETFYGSNAAANRRERDERDAEERRLHPEREAEANCDGQDLVNKRFAWLKRSSSRYEASPWDSGFRMGGKCWSELESKNVECDADFVHRTFGGAPEMRDALALGFVTLVCIDVGHGSERTRYPIGGL